MDAKLNTLSPVLPEANLRSEKPANDPKANQGQSFNSVFDHAAQKHEEAREHAKPLAKETPRSAAPRAAVKAEKPQAQTRVEETAPQQPLKVVKAQNQEVEPAPVQGETKGIDDKAGVIAQSYDGMAVSYPMSKIARESLDEKTVTKLKDAGLWDMPTLVMAQPSQQFAAMQNAGKELGADLMTNDLQGTDAFQMAKPISQFMASLENELGVEPDRLVKAFQDLPAGQLSEPPEKTMHQVVKNLGLSPKDEARASALFSKMLSQMKSMENESVDPALLATVAAGVQTPATQLGEKVSDKVPETAKGQGPSKAKVATLKYALMNSGNATQPTEKSSVASKSAKATDVDSVVKDEPQTFKPNVKETSAKDTKLSDTPSDFSKVSTPANESQGAVAVPKPLMPVENQVVQQSHTQVPDAFAATTLPSHVNQSEDKSAKEMVKGVKDSKDSLTIKGASAAPQPNVSQISSENVSQIAKPDVSGGAVTGGNVANAELKSENTDKHEAIRNIVNNAQMLAQKGGGEVRMILKPEHLGEIQLKVNMDGNRVNVSMTTEHSEVKKDA